MYYQRDRAWRIFHHPCIGRFHFLELSISLSPLYPTILKRMIESKHPLLDMGCCFAQDVRKLVSDGAPSGNIYGAELRQEFIDLGYDLFRDRDTLKSKFLIGDVFDDSDESEFKQIDGGIDIIYAASIFHLFNWDDQVRVAEQVVGLLRPVEGSIVFGKRRWNVNPAEYEHRTNQGGPDLLEADGPAHGFDGNKRSKGDGSLRFQVVYFVWMDGYVSIQNQVVRVWFVYFVWMHGNAFC